MTGPSLPLWEAVLRLVLVVVLAGAVGTERELRDQDAGLRTHMLVGLGSTLFVITGNYAWHELRFGNQAGVVLDPSRIVAYVVTGIGFLGAGAIIKNGASVRGLTTAASLWVVAAVGVGIGSGEYWLGAVGTAVIILSLWPVKRLAPAIGLRSTRTYRISIGLPAAADPTTIIESAYSAEGEIQSLSVTIEHGVRAMEISISTRAETARELFAVLAGQPHVSAASFDR